MIGAAAYVWIKALHVAAVIAFTSGALAEALFLGVARSDISADVVSKFHAAERRLTVPALLVALATGVTIATVGGWFSSPWLMIKLAFVVLLLALHGYQSGLLRRMAAGREAKARPMRSIVPAIVLVVAMALVTAIALLAVAKPAFS